MKYLLDTNIVIAFQKQHQGLLQMMYRYAVEDFAISSVVYFELAFGAQNSQQPESNLQKIKALPFAILHFDENDAFYAGQIRAQLKSKGTPIGAYDTLIAGQALARGLTLITHNVREFERVPNLKLADWLA